MEGLNINNMDFMSFINSMNKMNKSDKKKKKAKKRVIKECKISDDSENVAVNKDISDCCEIKEETDEDTDNSCEDSENKKLKKCCEDDDDGEELPPSDNTIPITDTVVDAQNFVIPCPPNTYTGPVTQPIYDKPPRITTPNVKTTKNSSCI